jgi:hypothetical protein
MRYLRCTIIFSALIVLICAQESSGQSRAIEADAWKGELPIRQPWLRDHLPDDSLAYLRIPHIFGLFATPKGNVLDAALRSKTNVENISKIRQGIVDNVLTAIPMLSDPRIHLFEQYVRSPIEISAKFLPAPSGLIAVNLDLDSNDSLNDLIGVLGFTLSQPLDSDGVGQIEGVGMPMAVQFDAASGRLLANIGPGVTIERFRDELDALNRDTPHHMRQMEDRVDASGQGLFFWIDAVNAKPALQMSVQPEQLQELNELGFDKVTAVGMGWGVANGKGRFALIADMPAGEDRGFVPVISNDLSAYSIGPPDGLFVLSIPTVEEFSRLEALFLATADGETGADWLEGKETIRTLTGVTFDEILATLGPEMLIIFDQAGDYAAIRLRDAKLWDSILERLEATTGIAPDSKRINRKTFYHLSTPNEYSMLDADAVGAEYGWFSTLLARQRDHTYWVQDGEFLYISSVPQVLIDRMALDADTNIGEWLKNSQRIDADSALISFSGTSSKIPQRLYTLYIELTQLLADVALTEIDVWSMPTVAQLGLPKKGTIGFTFSLGDPTLAAELTFESNPAEAFGGMGAVAMTGILAAIALPAYQDYTVRAEISTGLSLAASTKVGVTAFYQDNGTYPDGENAELLSIPESAGEYVSSVIVEPDTGTIIIDYFDTVGPDGGQIWMQPSADEGFVTWTCQGTFEEKHLPAMCR